MHKLIITDPAGVVINTKHYKEGEIIDGVPRGIAKACVHFKQARDIGAPTVRSRNEDKGTALEQFTKKLKTLLMDEAEMPEGKAADLIKANTHLVGLGALAGDSALDQTAFALIQTLTRGGGGVNSEARQSPHPASRLPMEAGAGVTAGGGTVVTNQPTAPLTQNVNVGGGTVAAPGAAALPDGGGSADRPSALQTATADAENAEVAAAADGKTSGGKKKSGK